MATPPLPIPKPLWAGLALASLLATATPSMAQEPHHQVLVGPGLMSLRHPPRFGYGSVELENIPVGSWFGGWAALDAGSRDAFFGVGPLVRFKMAHAVNLMVSTGPGVVSSDATTALGFRMEFRSSATLQWKLSQARSLAVSFSHYSNGGMSQHNPGAEGLRVLYGFSF